MYDLNQGKKVLCFITVVLVAFSFSACEKDDRDLISKIKEAPSLQNVLSQPEKFEYQIIYTQIDRNANDLPDFTEFRLNVDSSRYFYPASTIKMPIAILALEKLKAFSTIGLSRASEMEVDSMRPPQKKTVRDSLTGKFPTIAELIERVFIVSDNEANNRLYEFVGQDELHSRMRAHSINNTRIVHRLGDPDFGPGENKITNRIRFYRDNKLIYEQAEHAAGFIHPDHTKGSIKGKGYIDGNGEQVNEPFDFRKKNFFPLTDQLHVLKAIMFPTSLPAAQVFNLKNDDYPFLWKAMSTLPRDSRFREFHDEEHYDSYAKFFIFGDSKETIPSHIRIFNKVGWAYGYLTDCSYIIDTKNNFEFLLAATIHVNQNEIYNDGVYEYETVGLPFLAELGRIVYDHELNRKRLNKPDLSRYKQLR